MFVLEGLNFKKRSNSSSYSVEDIIEFVGQEMKDDEKKKEFFKRKLKDTQKVIVIGFDSIDPITLSIHHVYEMDDTSELIKFSENVFDPLFFGYNISNHQYKKLEGAGTDKLYRSLSANSFSNFYINNKVLDKVLPDMFHLTVPEGTPDTTSKILTKFYEWVNKTASDFIKDGIEKPGCDFIIDFNTISKIEGTTLQEQETFLNKLIADTGMSVTYQYANLQQDQNINKFLYCLDSLHHYSTILGMEVNEKDLTDVLDEEIPLTFEMPTGEKPLLGKKRHKSVESDLPTLTYLELLLMRYLVVLINKQGKVEESGYTFTLKEGNDRRTTLTRKMQITADKNGNFALNKLEIVDEQIEEGIKQRIVDLAEYYFEEDIDFDFAFSTFKEDYYEKILNIFFENQVKEKELVEQRWKEHNYKQVAKILYEGAYRNLKNRIKAYQDKTKKPVYRRDIIKLLYVIDVCHDRYSKEKGWLTFMKKSFDTKEIVEKEELTSSEVHYLLGATAAMISRSSRNSESLLKTFAQQKRTEDVVKNINKRLKSGLSEIDYLPMIGKWMKLILTHLETMPQKRQMSVHEDAAYMTGLISESRTKKPEAKGEEKNDKN